MSLTEEQYAERHTGLGGSDAAPALALSPYKSPLELFLEKRERPELGAAENASLHWGKVLEPVIRQEYSTATGRIVRLPTGTLRHQKHRFMLAHVDGVTDDARVFEAKTARTADGWGAPGTEEVPHHYLIQVQHYLAVTGFKVADIAVLIGGNDFRIFEIPADPELQEMIIDHESDFWHLVETNTPPPPDWDVDTVAVIERLYPGTDGKTIIANEDAVTWYETLRRATELRKSYESVADGAKAHLLHIMGNAARLVFTDAQIQLQRKQVERKAYTVPASNYIDSRLTKLKETA